MGLAMSSILIQFPDGAKEFRWPADGLNQGDTIWHDGQAYRVLSVHTEESGPAHATVDPVPRNLGDVLKSEEGAIRLEAFEETIGS
jgi:hypothetical protein